MDEKTMLEWLGALPPAARRDLLPVLRSDSDVRADIIRQFHSREETRDLAEVLMDMETDDGLRLQVIGLLHKLNPE